MREKLSQIDTETYELFRPLNFTQNTKTNTLPNYSIFHGVVHF